MSLPLSQGVIPVIHPNERFYEEPNSYNETQLIEGHLELPFPIVSHSLCTVSLISRLLILFERLLHLVYHSEQYKNDYMSELNSVGRYFDSHHSEVTNH